MMSSFGYIINPLLPKLLQSRYMAVHQPCSLSHFHQLPLSWSILHRAKNWRSHGCQWRVKTDQGYQKLRFEHPMYHYATEGR